MKYFLLLLITYSLFSYNISFAQSAGSSNRLKLDIFSVYESRTLNDSTNFSEFTNGIWASYFLSSLTRLSLTTRYASVGGDVNSLNGFSDTQLLFNHSLAENSIGLEAGINIPSGRTKLSEEEFATSRIVSQNIFDMNTSNFGQGLNAFAGITLTQPASKNIVLGAGLSYQLKNEYQPIDASPEKYKPSNEISVTGGIDIKLSELSTFTGDITGIFYGSDQFEGKDVFTAGNRFIFNTLYKYHFGYDVLMINVLYRLMSVDEIEGAEVLDDEKVNPNQFYTAVSYFQRINANFSMTYSGFISLYEETVSIYSNYTMLGLRLTPEFRLSARVTIPVVLRFATASASDKPTLTNFDIGSGIKINI